MKSLSGVTLTALNSGSIAIVQLLHLNFSTGVVALNTSTWNFDYGGVTYLGASGLGAISNITDTPGEVEGLTFELFADTSHIAQALDESNVVQGTICTVRTAIIETTNYTILDAPVEWVGKLDTMSITEDGDKAIISVSAESKAVDLMSGNSWLYTTEDQLRINPYDTSFAYVVDQVDKPIIWPAKAYFYK